MYASKVFMELLPNVHLLGVFTISLHLFIGKGAVPDLHVYIIEWVVCGICDMVDTVSVSLDNSVGRDHAASTKNSEEDTANCVHGRKRMSRIFVWNTLCTGAGNSFGLSFKGMIAWIIAGLPWDLCTASAISSVEY